MDFSKPKVTIDLEEYEYLKKWARGEVILPFLKVGQEVSIVSRTTILRGRVNQVNVGEGTHPSYGIGTQAGPLELIIIYDK